MAGVNFLYYCSLQDVRDLLLNFKTGTADLLKPKVLRKAISKAYGQLNAALKTGGYSVPVTNSVKTLTTAAETASDDPVVIAVTAGDGENFSIGSTVRIHGLFTTDSQYEDEFTGIILIATDNITVEFLEDGYDAGATMELCTEGFLFIRNCLANGGAYIASKGLHTKDVEVDSMLDRMRDDFDKCLEKLRNGEVELDGLDKDSGTVFIETQQTQNSDDRVDAIFEREMDH